MVTLQDIAERLGTSKATISMALRGNPLISAKRREQVRRTAAQMGYRPNMQASSLRRGRKPSVGVFLPEWPDVLLLDLIKGLSAGSDEHEIPLKFSFGMTAGAYHKFVNSMASHKHTGIISYVPSWDRNYKQTLGYFASYASDGGHLLFLNNYSDELKNHLSINIDDVHGAQLAANHLAADTRIKSYAAIGLVSATDKVRMKAFADFVSERGDEARRYEIAMPCAPDVIRATILRMIDQAARPVGIFSTSSEVSVFIQSILQSRGWHRGQDYKLVSYDMAPQRGDLEPVTRIIQPFHEMGVLAISKLSQMLANEEACPELLKPKLHPAIEDDCAPSP